MDKVKFINKVADMVKSDKLVQKHMRKHSWHSGSSTEVAPITCWVESGQIEVQLDTHRNVFNKCLNRIIAHSNGCIKDGYFIRYDGSCPAILKFVVDYSVA